jgi:C-terminal processing protease CtpA/Prc
MSAGLDGQLVDDDATAAYGYEATRRLTRLMADQPPLRAERCLQLIDVALTILTEAYVHLPLKKALYAVDPESRLRLYRSTILEESLMHPEVDPRAFHAEMTDIFASLHDRHTRYLAPPGLGDWDAFLPFTVEEYWESPEGPARFVVSRVAEGVKASVDLVGAEVTHWNGVPIERAVARLGENSGGANREAQRAHGIEALTVRSLNTTPPPDEEWVEVAFRPERGGRLRQRRITWYAGRVPEEQRSTARLGSDTADADAIGIDDDAHRIGQGKRVIVHAPVQTLPVLKPYAAYAIARPVRVAGQDYGHLRLRSFLVPDGRAFVAAVAAALRELPDSGVIVDIRGNPGGSVTVAERLLQLFCDDPIVPEPLQLRTTRLALRLADSPVYERWRRTVEQGVQAGGGYSAGYPCLAPPEDYRGLGRAYDGPVVLVVDALSYSASDFFAAGWQDNEIGKVLGTAERTGAGGATRLTYPELRERLDDASELPDLGEGEHFTVAVRRSVRVGENNGVLVEDFGVTPDADPVYRLTREDVMACNRGLLERAAELLEP